MYQKIAGLALLTALIGMTIYLVDHRQNAAADNPEDQEENLPLGPPISSLEADQYMLELVNEARVKSGLMPVRLGDNPAVQMHAQASLRYCTLAHWDIWGLKPNWRYTLTGGAGTGDENIRGRNYCSREHEPHEGINRRDVYNAMQSWLESRGHRANILHPRHTIMNVGIAHDPWNLVMAQQFSSDYVEYTTRPEISQDGVLRMSGDVRRAVLDTGPQVVIQIGYDPPPEPLTRSQLSKTHALCHPRTVGTIWGVNPRDLEPNPRAIMQKSACRDPRENPRDAPPPASIQDSLRNWKEARGTSMIVRERPVDVYRIEPSTLRLDAHSFNLEADLQPVLLDYGPGVYSITLWGTPDRMNWSTVLSEQSIFWGTEPPENSPYGHFLAAGGQAGP